MGRRTLAVRFAQALNCTNPPAPGEFCGTCPDCKKTAVLRHPDLAIIEPIIKDGSLKVEQVRDAQRLLSMKPFMARFRISLFPDFQAATISAQNAMLKTLEEAPAHAILLLIANDPEQLLSTIVSRCEVLRLRTPGIQGVEKMLQGEGVDPVKARFLAHLSEGRPGWSKTMLAEGDLVHTRAQRLDELRAGSALSGGGWGCAGLRGRKERFQQAVCELLQRLRSAGDLARAVEEAWPLSTASAGVAP